MRKILIALGLGSLLISQPICIARSDGSFPGKGSYTAWVNANTFLKYGNEAAQKNDLDRALDWYKKAVQTYEFDSIYYFNLGNAFSMKGQFHIAEEAYRKAIDLEDDYFQAWLNLGHAIAKQGRAQEAAKALRKAASLSQNPVEKAEIEKQAAQLDALPGLQAPPAPPKEKKKKKEKKIKDKEVTVN